VSYPKKGEVRRLMPDECEGVMAFPPDWTVPSKVEWDEETYDTLRYHALGNAVTPPVAEWLAHRIKAHLDRAIGLPHHERAHGTSRRAAGVACESPFAPRVAEASTN